MAKRGIPIVSQFQTLSLDSLFLFGRECAEVKLRSQRAWRRLVGDEAL
jgi:hypothetical protein